MTEAEAKKKGNPTYTGLRKYVSVEGGFGIWYPAGWSEIPMAEGHHGVILAPDPNNINTCVAAEKHILPFKVVRGDVPVLRKGIEEGLNALPGVEVEWRDESITSTLIFFDVRYTFLEDGVRRKRWLRNVYWGEGQLVLLAQGQTVEAYDYYLPMFYNTLMTPEVGLPI